MDMKANITCETCGKVFPVKLKEMFPGNSVTCACGTKITFRGDDMRKAQTAMSDLEKALKKFGKL